VCGLGERHEGSRAQHHGRCWLHPGPGQPAGSREVKVAVVGRWWRGWESTGEAFPFGNTNRLVLGKGMVLSESPRGN